MNRMKLAAIVSIAVLSSACASSSKYAVTTPPAAEHQQLTLNNEPLVSIPKTGPWIWRMKPEDVVSRLAVYSGELGNLLSSCQADLAKYRPAKPKAKPAAAAPAKASAKVTK